MQTDMTPITYLFIALTFFLVGVVVYLYKVYVLPQDRAVHVDNSVRTDVTDVDKLRKEIQDKDDIIKSYESDIEEFLQILEMKPNFDKETDAANDNDVKAFIDNVLNRYPQGCSIEGKENYFKRNDAGTKAFELFMRIRSYMNNVQMSLQSQDTPLTPEQKRANMEKVLDMAMVAFDAITSFYSVNARAEQNINKQLLDGTISRAEALAKASQMTNLSSETPAWIRVLKESLEYAGISESEVIFSGYKL